MAHISSGWRHRPALRECHRARLATRFVVIWRSVIECRIFVPAVFDVISDGERGRDVRLNYACGSFDRPVGLHRNRDSEGAESKDQECAQERFRLHASSGRLVGRLGFHCNCNCNTYATKAAPAHARGP